MKKLVYILPLILSLNCFGQGETKEGFVNEVYRTFVMKDGAYYLYKKGVMIDKEDIRNLKNYFAGKVSDTTLREIAKNSRRSKRNYRWDFKTLTNAVIVNKDSAEILALFSEEIKLRKGRDADKKNGYTKRMMERRVAISGVYYFSAPVFDKKNEYAILYMWFHCGRLCDHGGLYLFRKINGKWENIACGGCWIS